MPKAPKKFIYLLRLSLAIVAIDGSATAAEKTVTFSSWSPIVETTNKMIAAFHEKNPDMKIEAKIFNYPDYLVELQTWAAGNSLLDIIGLEPGTITQQYKNFLLPLQDLAVKVWGKDWKEKFYPIAIEQARLGNPKGDENFYGLPVLTQTINLWYTVPIFQEIGAQPPKTYDEMLKIAQAVQAKGVAPLLVGAGDGWLRRDIYMQLIHNIAPGLIYKAEAGEAKFTDPPFVSAMQWWKRLFDDGIIQPGAVGLSAYPGSMELIEGGRAAMFPMGSWWQQQASRPNPPPLSKGLSGFAPMRFPDVTGKGQPDDCLGGIDVMFGISKSAKDPEAAFRVLADWIAGAGAQALINTFNDLPAIKGLSPQKFETDNQRQVWQLFVDDWLPKVKYARQLQKPEVKQAFEDVLAAVATGELSPEQAMQRVQAAADKAR
jgi:raffinose/stachyose/melibiose transport system substrate-binding protein